MDTMNNWWIFRGEGTPHGDWKLPPQPSWRRISPQHTKENFICGKEEKDAINAALYLRRPLFITGKPGCGKSSLAYAVAEELELGHVLVWNINSRSTRQEGLYYYDAIKRLQDASLNEKRSDAIPNIGDYIYLGPLGIALLPYDRPRVLLIDEIDKSDIDLPNDLLTLLEEGQYDIPELVPRANRSEPTSELEVVEVISLDNRNVSITGGHVRCMEFPFVVLTSNSEREFSPAFLRRCICLHMQPPDKDQLGQIVETHFKLEQEALSKAYKLIQRFMKRRERKELATDQLLNAIYLVMQGSVPPDNDIIEQIWHSLSSEDASLDSLSSEDTSLE